MLRVKKLSEIVGRQVYTSDGDYFGQVEEVNLVDNKIDGWKIKLTGGFTNLLGGAKGVVIPQQFVIKLWKNVSTQILSHLDNTYSNEQRATHFESSSLSHNSL